MKKGLKKNKWTRGIIKIMGGTKTGGEEGESRDTEGSVQVTVAPFCIFPARHRGHDFDPLAPLCSSPFFPTLSAIVLVHLRSPFLYVHVCYIHLDSFLQYLQRSHLQGSRALWTELISLANTVGSPFFPLIKYNLIKMAEKKEQILS